jgi:hypothetical protein
MTIRLMLILTMFAAVGAGVVVAIVYFVRRVASPGRGGRGDGYYDDSGVYAAGAVGYIASSGEAGDGSPVVAPANTAPPGEGLSHTSDPSSAHPGEGLSHTSDPSPAPSGEGLSHTSDSSPAPADGGGGGDSGGGGDGGGGGGGGD